MRGESAIAPYPLPYLLKQLLVIAVLMWSACVADLGWTAWTGLRVAPAFLELVVVIACLVCKPRLIVFWGGFAGLLVSVVHAEPIHFCVPLFASVTLVAAWTKPSEMKRPTVASVSIRSLLILIVLVFGRVAVQEFPSTEFLTVVDTELLAQVMLTFLISIAFCLFFTFLKRRTVWE